MFSHSFPISVCRRLCARWAMAALLTTGGMQLYAQTPATSETSGPRASDTRVESVLFVGNSFFFASGSPVRFYRPEIVTDLNNGGVGGVPALFQTLAEQAGKKFAVSLETVGGQGLDYHFKEKANVIGQAWDRAVLLGYSTLNRTKPGDPAVLIESVRQVAELLHGKNPAVDIRLVATWSRADQVYPEKGHWHGKPIETMAQDIRRAYDQAAAGSSFVKGVIPVGEAWNRAFAAGVADPNPYDGIAFKQVSLWTFDHYHPSTYGYYLEALMIFGDLTGLDPRSFGKSERAAFELGLSTTQTVALQDIAAAELAARPGKPALASFKPILSDRAAEYQRNR